MKPTPFQERVLGIPEDVSIALPGGRGGGKTSAVLLVILRHLALYGAAAKALIVRRSFPALKEIEERLVALFAAAMPAAQYNRAAHELRVPGGGAVELGHLEGESDFARYVGRESTILAIDEVTLWPSLRALNLLRSNLRSPAGVPVRTLITCNPGGPGHVPVGAAFVHSRVPWVPYELAPGDWWITATSTLDDNPHIPAGYEVQLRAACAGDDGLWAAWRRGDFSAIGGAFFSSQWGPHLILPNVDWTPAPRSGWSTFWSFDFGMSSPGVALGVAVAEQPGLEGPGGVVYPEGSRLVLCEVHSADPSDASRGLQWPIDVWAEELLAAGETHGISAQGCADDARGLGLDESVISELRRHGIHMRRPNKASRTGGWAVLKGQMHAAKVRDPDAAWFQIHPRCIFTLETMAALPRDSRRIEDCDSSANDHSSDAARYAALHEPPKPQPVGGMPMMIVNTGGRRWSGGDNDW